MSTLHVRLHRNPVRQLLPSHQTERRLRCKAAESQGRAGQRPPDGVSLVAGTLQSSPVIPSPSGSLSGSQDDSDSDMAFSVNQSSSASESSLGKEMQTWGGCRDRGRGWPGSFPELSRVVTFPPPDPPHPLLPQLCIQLAGRGTSRYGTPKGDSGA